MVEIFNIERTKSFGCFVNFKSAKGTLNGLIASGELSGENPAVLVCCYKNNDIAVAAYFVFTCPRVPCFGF